MLANDLKVKGNPDEESGTCVLQRIILQFLLCLEQNTLAI